MTKFKRSDDVRDLDGEKEKGGRFFLIFPMPDRDYSLVSTAIGYPNDGITSLDIGRRVKFITKERCLLTDEDDFDGVITVVETWTVQGSIFGAVKLREGIIPSQLFSALEHDEILTHGCN